MQLDIAPRKSRSVGLTPLIDVVFNLLLFFMLASSLVDWHGLELATGSEALKDDAAPAAEVTLQNSGSLRYQGEDLSLQALSERLLHELENNNISSVILRTDPGVNLGAVVDSFDQLSHAGIDALALGEAVADTADSY